MDNRQQIKPGDFFNITREASGNEVWDNQNRFSTCVLDKVLESGEWQYRECWYEYSSGDYPFFSSPITWNVFNSYAMQCTFEKIEDPETQGFKDKKQFLPQLLAKRIAKLKKEYNDVSRRIILDVIANKDLTEYAIESMGVLERIAGKLKTNGDDDEYYQYHGTIDAEVGGHRFPLVSFSKKGTHLWGMISGPAIGTVGRVFLHSKEIEVETEGWPFLLPFSGILPNDRLYPIDFAMVHPYSSVFQNCECESLAARILYFTDDWGEPLTWEQYYETMTVADKGYSSAIKKDFDRLQPFLKNPDTCATFSGAWAQFKKQNEE